MPTTSQFIFQEGNPGAIILPTLMYHRLVGVMDVFRQLESYITLDTSRIFNVVLLQHTQPEENTPGPTLASQYTGWYLDKLVEHIRSGDVCYAPLRMCFVRKHQMAPSFNAELYTNIAELQVTTSMIYTSKLISVTMVTMSIVFIVVLTTLPQALAKMLGPYGIKFLGEQLMERCESCVHEMLSIVQENKEMLVALRACTMDQFPTAQVKISYKY